MRQRDWIRWREEHPTKWDQAVHRLLDAILEPGPFSTESEGKVEAVMSRVRSRHRYQKRARRLGWHAISKKAKDPQT
jgi:hypothetical protein